MRNELKLLAVCALASAALGGCGGGSLASGGEVRLVNATTEFATLALYDGSTRVSANVDSNTVGGYVDLDKGDHTFNVADGTTGATAATLTGTVSKGDHFTIVAYAAGGSLATVYLSDEEGEPSSGTAKLRFFNTAATDVASVDAYLVATACANLSGSLSTPIATSVSGLQTTYTQVNATSAGATFHICITAAGDKTDLRLDIPAVTLRDQEIVTVVLTPTPGGVLLNGLLLDQQGTLMSAPNTSARVRVAVGAAGGAAVTATVNGVALGTALSAPAVGNYKLVPLPASGALTIALTVGGTATSPSGLVATPGADLTLLVTGTAASTPVLIPDDNSASTSTANPVKLRLVNGMNGVTGTAVLTDDFDNVGDGAAFGAASSYAQVPDSVALARLEATVGATRLCLSTDVTLTAAKVYTVFLLGDIPAVPGTCTLRLDR